MNALTTVLVVVGCIALQSLTINGQNCSDNATLRYEAAKEVAMYFRDEAQKVKDLLDSVLETKRVAKEALSTCIGELESYKDLKAERIKQAGLMAKEVARLESEKAASKAAFDRALHAFNAAKGPQSASSNDAHTARQQAIAALKVAKERSRVAGLFWAKANAAQQSTKWVPATNADRKTKTRPGHLQMATTFGSRYAGKVKPASQTSGAPDASKLTERAKAAEYAAAVAEAEAKRLNDIAVAAERAAEASWKSISPAQRTYAQADREYQAVCQVYAEKKAAYDAAVMSIHTAETYIFKKQECVDEAKKNLGEEKDKIPALRAQQAAALALAQYAQDLAERLKNMTDTTEPEAPVAPEAPVETPAATPPRSPPAQQNSLSWNSLRRLIRRFNDQARRTARRYTAGRVTTRRRPNRRNLGALGVRVVGNPSPLGLSQMLSFLPRLRSPGSLK